MRICKKNLHRHCSTTLSTVQLCRTHIVCCTKSAQSLVAHSYTYKAVCTAVCAARLMKNKSEPIPTDRQCPPANHQPAKMAMLEQCSTIHDLKTYMSHLWACQGNSWTRPLHTRAVGQHTCARKNCHTHGSQGWACRKGYITSQAGMLLSTSAAAQASQHTKAHMSQQLCTPYIVTS